MRAFVFFCSALLLCCADNSVGPGTSTGSGPASTQENPPPAPAPAESGQVETPTENNGNVTITRPVDGASLEENPIRVEGTARTFENNVVLEVLDQGGDRILRTSTTATGELGEFNPWSAELWLTEWPGERVTVRAAEYSARDGSLSSLATVQLRNNVERREVTLFFPNARRSPNDCSVVYPVQHILPESKGIARLLTEALISGPTRFEQAQGYTSEFPQGTRVDSISIDGTTATVNLGVGMQNVGGSCRVQAIRASLENTLKQLPNIDRVRIAAGGSEELALQP